MVEELSFYCLHTPDHFGEILPDAHWFGTAIRAGWVFRGKEGWWLREGENRPMRMGVDNRLVEVSIGLYLVMVIGGEDR